MRFYEVTNRLSEAVPSMKNMRVWRSSHGGYTWVISYDPGFPGWSSEEIKKCAVYMASYRKAGHTTSNETIEIDGGPWDSFERAKSACKNIWKSLRALN